MIANIHYVNNSGTDISMFFPFFQDAYKTGNLHEDIADLFEVLMLHRMNADGSARMIINAHHQPTKEPK